MAVIYLGLLDLLPLDWRLQGREDLGRLLVARRYLNDSWSVLEVLLVLQVL